MSLQDVERLVSSLGLPSVFLVGILYVIWWFIRQITPSIQSAANKHSDLVDSLKDTSKKQADTLDKQTDLLKSVHDLGKRTNAGLSHLSDAVEGVSPEDKKDQVREHTRRAKDDFNRSSEG